MIARKYYKVYIKDILSFYLRASKSIDYLTVFQDKIKNTTKFKKAIALRNGRSAIILALRNIRQENPDKNEIITSAYNLGELIPLLENENFKIKLVDVNPKTWLPTSTTIKEAISENTCAILIPQIYGNSQGCTEIATLIKNDYPEIKYINDCAHVFGTSHMNIGDYTILSFQHNKPLSCGGGGMLLTSEEIELASLVKTENIEDLKTLIKQLIEKALINTYLYRFIRPILFSKTLSEKIQGLYRRTNNSPSIKVIARLSQLKAYLGLKELESYTTQQETLKNNFKALKGLLNDQYIFQQRDEDNNFYNAVVLTQEDPDLLREKLAQHGFDIGVKTEVMDDCLKVEDSVSSKLAKKNILLPIHIKTNLNDIEKLAKILNECSPRLGNKE